MFLFKSIPWQPWVAWLVVLAALIGFNELTRRCRAAGVGDVHRSPDRAHHFCMANNSQDSS